MGFTDVFDRQVRSRWRNSSHEHRAIARGMAAVTSFVFIAKLAGAAKEMAVAWRYGVGGEVDAYLFVLNLVNWPVAIWLGVLTVILIPTAARIREETPAELPQFRAELLAFTLVLGLTFGAVFALAMPTLLHSAWLGLPPRTAALAVRMAPTLGWLVVPGMLAGLYSAWLMSAGGHLNTLAEGLPAVGILVAVLVTGGVEPLVWGTMIGTIVQVGFLIRLKPTGARELPSFRLSSPQWKLFWQALSIMMLGQAIMSFTTIIDQFFAAHLGEGAISELGYSGRILSLMLSLVATAVTRATLPVFSAARLDSTKDMRKLALRLAATMGLVGIVMCAVGWVLAPLGVRILFQRGTFHAGDTQHVAMLLRYSMLQLPFYFASLVLVSLYSSAGRYALLALSSALALFVKAASSYLLIPRLGVVALVVSPALMYAANTILFVLARER